MLERVVDLISLVWQSLVLAAVVVIPSLIIWWLSPWDFFLSLLIVYGLGTVLAIYFLTGPPVPRFEPGQNSLSEEDIRAIINAESRGSSGLEPVYGALHRLAHGLLWPALIIYRLRHVDDFSILRDDFGIPFTMYLFPSELILSFLTTCVTILLVIQPESTLPHRIVLLACLILVLARHLAYVLSPVSLKEVFRREPGNVFVRLLLVGFLDLATLTAVFASWTDAGWVRPTLVSFADTVVSMLTPESPVETLIGLESTLRDRFQMVSILLYLLAVGRIIWPPKDLERSTQDLNLLGSRFALQGRYTEALHWLYAVKEPDTTTIGLVAHCHLGRGELEEALAYAGRNTPSSVARMDFAILLLLNSVHMLELPYGYAEDWPDLRPRLRTSQRLEAVRQLLDQAAEAHISDAILWHSHVSISLFRNKIGPDRDAGVERLLASGEYFLTRSFLDWEDLENELFFIQGLKSSNLQLAGMAERTADLEGKMLGMHERLLTEEPRSSTDQLLNHCLVLLVSFPVKDKLEDWENAVTERINVMKELLLNMQNDFQRILAIQTLQIFDAYLVYQVGTEELSERFYKLTQQAAISLDSVVPWWAKMVLAVFRQERMESAAEQFAALTTE